jgi:hypothetical protein
MILREPEVDAQPLGELASLGHGDVVASAQHRVTRHDDDVVVDGRAWIRNHDVPGSRYSWRFVSFGEGPHTRLAS